MSEEEDDLMREVDAGNEAANAVVDHLIRMGSSRGTIPVWKDGIEFRVIVERADCEVSDAA